MERPSVKAEPASKNERRLNMKVIFLGDSITDVGRNSTNGSMISIGQGYPLIVTAKLSAAFPGRYVFYNTGVSGSRVVDLYARVKSDAWDIDPDVVSILVGVNDVWHEYMELHSGVDASRYETIYRMLLTDTKRACPHVKHMLLEPFCLCGSATEPYWPEFQQEVALRAKIVRKLAAEFRCCYVPLQERFDAACRQQPGSYWLADGGHPTPAGHQILADAWLGAFPSIQQC